MITLLAINPARIWISIQLFRLRRSAFYVAARRGGLWLVCMLLFVPMVGGGIARDLLLTAGRRLRWSRLAYWAGLLCGVVLGLLLLPFTVCRALFSRRPRQ